MTTTLTGQGNSYSCPGCGYHPNGNFVRIAYDDGTEGVYLHLDRVWVSPGARVDLGDSLAAADNTGRSRGDHLHYTEWVTPGDRQHALNPEDLYGGCP